MTEKANEECDGCIYFRRYGSGKRLWAVCTYPGACNDGDRYEAMPAGAPNPAGDKDKQSLNERAVK